MIAAEFCIRFYLWQVCSTTVLETVMIEVILIGLVALSMLSSAFFITLVSLVAIFMLPPRWSYFVLLTFFVIAFFESGQFHLFANFVVSGLYLDFQRLVNSFFWYRR
jgi:hypothetical protein